MKKEENLCPYCNRDMFEETPRSMATLLVNIERVVSEQVNPGGREIVFLNKGKEVKVQLSDHCNWCDYEKVKEACGWENMTKPQEEKK